MFVGSFGWNLKGLQSSFQQHSHTPPPTFRHDPCLLRGRKIHGKQSLSQFCWDITFWCWRGMIEHLGYCPVLALQGASVGEHSNSFRISNQENHSGRRSKVCHSLIPGASVQNILIEDTQTCFDTHDTWHSPQFLVQPAGLTSGHPPTVARAVKTALAFHPGIHPVHPVKMAQVQSSPKNVAMKS